VSFSDRPLSVRLSVNFYIFDFSKTTWPILTRLGINHPEGEWILNYSNKGEHPRPRGDNNALKFLKNIFLQNQQANLNQT
jgi:hypothetical protein